MSARPTCFFRRGPMAASALERLFYGVNDLWLRGQDLNL